MPVNRTGCLLRAGPETAAAPFWSWEGSHVVCCAVYLPLNLMGCLLPCWPQKPGAPFRSGEGSHLVCCAVPSNFTGCLLPCWASGTACTFVVTSLAGSCPAGGECALPTARRFWAPTTEETDYWYSYDFGPIHFLMYSTEHEFTKGGCTACSSYTRLKKAPEAVL